MQPAILAYRQVSQAMRRGADTWVRRAVSHGPEAILVRAAFVVLVGAVAARLHTLHDPGIVCPLRGMTGIPCPFCGSTSAVMELGSGDLAAAVSTQPATMLAVGIVVTQPAGWFRRWAWLPHRRKVALLLAAVAASWAYQLIRLGVIG